MLTSLTLKHIVIVRELELHFERGFSALTGETGAGKSILVDALTLLIGARADSTLIRAGAERAEVTGVFTLTSTAPARAWLATAGFADADDADDIIVRRVVDAQGKSRAWINGTPASLQQCRELGERLIDIHGQHAHQQLLRADAQRALLDAYADHAPLVASVSAAWQQWRQAIAACREASEHSAANEAKRQQLTWQVDELTRLQPQGDEWLKLEHEHQRLAHASGLLAVADFAVAALVDADQAAVDILGSVGERISPFAELDPAMSEAAALIASAQSELSEAASGLRRFASRFDTDPERLATVEARLAALSDCARKYRIAPTALADQLALWQDELTRLQQSEDRSRLERHENEAAALYHAAAARLSASRQQAATRLAATASGLMQSLALGNGKLAFTLTPLAEGSAQGSEQVVINVAGLASDDWKPLAKVASGGELSRISLALQVAASEAATAPTLIFDEVDVGIGGGVAEVVGRLLNQLAHQPASGIEQILCVTHLPQVAARADHQFKVQKTQETSGGVTSTVVALSDQERVGEIARMLGGVDLTDLTHAHAHELLYGSAPTPAVGGSRGSKRGKSPKPV